jgi:hypothetical protein
VKPDETGLIEELLRRRAQAAGAAGGPLCGDPELLAAYAENSLAEEERESFQIHLASCAACRDAVAGLVRMAPREVAPDLAGRSASWWKRWMWVPALATVIVTGSVVLMNRQSLVKEPNRLTERGAPFQPQPPAARTEKPAIAAPARKEPVAKVLNAPVAIDSSLAGTTIAPEKKQSGAANAVVGGSIAAQDVKVADELATLRKQEEPQAPAGLAAGPPSQPFMAPPPQRPVPAPLQQSNATLSNQVQNFTPPAPSAGNQQNGGNANAVVVNTDSVQLASNNSQVASDKTRMLRMAPQTTKAPAPTPTSGLAGAAGAASVASPAFAAKMKAAMATPKGRIEKGAFQILTDGSATWQTIVTPEPVLSFRITDALNFEIRTRSLTTFRTKDGGKTWQAEKAP